MIEDLGVVGALGQSVKPHADRLISVSFPDVEVGQSVSQSAGLGTQLQQRLAQSDAIIKPAVTRQERLQPECLTRPTPPNDGSSTNRGGVMVCLYRKS